MSVRSVVVFAFSGLLAWSASAKTNYVNCAMQDYAGHDGTTWEKAFKTIQEGVNACVKGDTVLVAKGRYAEGGGTKSDEPDFMNRVYIGTEGITIKAVAGKKETFIVGAPDSDPADSYGNGPNAVRCVFANASDCVIEGFTLTDGASHPPKDTPTKDAPYCCGGGFRGLSTGSTSCLVDCTVTNCTGVRAGAIYQGRAVRTLFIGNASSWKAGVGNNSRLVNCVMTHNTTKSGSSMLVSGEAVNCTIYDNPVSCVGSEKASFRNCLLTWLYGDTVGDAAESGPLTGYNSVFPKGANGSGAPYFSIVTNSVTNAVAFQLENPLLGDIRLLPTSAAVNIGDPSWLAKDHLALPARVERFLDFAGNPIPQEGAIHAGALQVVGPEPAGGALVFDKATVSVDGCAAQVANGYVLASETYPTQFLVKAWAASGAFYGFKRIGMGIPSSGVYVFPRPDDTVYMLPPRAGGSFTNTFVTAAAAKCFYVDPKGSDTANDGLSAQAPFKTIQKAVDSAGTSYSVIRCAAGDYDSEDGLKVSQGLTNRVTIASNQGVRIIGAGIGKTVIWGKADPGAGGRDAAHYYGGGPGAIRCFCSNATGGNAIQAVTFRGGRVNYSGTDDDTNHQGQGAGAWFMGGQQVLDCAFDDCVGYRGACFGNTNGKVLRCRFANCYGYNGCIRYSKVYMSVLDGNKRGGGNAVHLSFNSTYQHMTVVGLDKEDQTVTDITIRNSVLSSLNSTASGWNSDWSGTFVADCKSCGHGTPADQLLADAANGNYRILTTSPAFGGGAIWDDYVLDYSPDVNGSPVQFMANGAPLPGAVQEVAQGLRVIGDGQNGVALTAPKTGYLAPGESVTVTYDESQATRPIAGLLVNGEESPVVPSLTFTAPDAGEPVVKAFSVGPIFSTNWYVNANAADNRGNGFRPETAKRSFHEVGGIFETGLVKAGDCVHAAAGTYDKGAKDEASDMRNRVSVPSKVALVADEGPEVTFIVGAEASDGSGDPMGKGRGDDAVRCVTLWDGSRIRGFTITGGRARNVDTGLPQYGGGIYCRHSQFSYAEDCIISNNAAQRGGGMHNGSAVNCRFFDNWAYKNRAAMSQGYMYGCIVDHNRGANASQNTSGLWNCTFGEDNLDLSGNVTQSAGMPFGPVVNCLFMGKFQSDTTTKCYCTNCVFITGGFVNAQYSEYFDCITNDVADIVLDADYAPVIGSCEAVDAGYFDADAVAMGGGADHYGSQRVANGRIDIGAVEADWRPHYAAALGAGVTVTNASSEVTLGDDGKVHLADGATLAGFWTQLQPNRRTRYSGDVTATDGTIAGTVGETAVSVTDGADAFSFKTKADVQGFDFAFVGTGDGALSGFEQFVPGVLLMLR